MYGNVVIAVLAVLAVLAGYVIGGFLVKDFDSPPILEDVENGSEDFLNSPTDESVGDDLTIWQSGQTCIDNLGRGSVWAQLIIE